MKADALASAVFRLRRNASSCSRFMAPRLMSLGIGGCSTSAASFSAAALVSSAAFMAMASICSNRLEGCCLSAAVICAGSVMPCSAAWLSRAATLS